MRSMIRSHHITAQLVAEHQRDLRASSRPGGRLSALSGRGTAEPEPVPSLRSVSGDAGRELRVRRGVIARGVPANVPAVGRSRTPEQPVR
jgi:hypothetical protein